MSTDDAPSTHPGPADYRRDVARQLAGQGLSNRKIGREMGVSEATVRRWLRPDMLALPLTPDLRDDLAVLAQTGLDDATAVARAVQLLANAYRTVWDYDDVPRGTEPHIHVIATAQPQRVRPGG